ncbi:uncharacterized protein AKAME5_000067900 [Lates japonicus]|uniref:Uncharacterized protein n=1 Tax=Lates japonicus TaxID=270547 RepID=A0AAD3M2E4_LATJO|nr:uncharacterized protein AKAME5_000067900 [Lates japonicus]
MSQCLRLDPDLDPAPPRRWPAMEVSAPKLKERNDPNMDAAAEAPAATTAPATTPPQLKQRPQFRPTTTELRHLLMTQMGNKWSKVAGDFPAGELRLANAAWENDENADRIRAAFPLSLDMGKISACRFEKMRLYLIISPGSQRSTQHTVASKDQFTWGGHPITPWGAHL